MRQNVATGRYIDINSTKVPFVSASGKLVPNSTQIESMSTNVEAPLPQGAGYGVVVGLGVAFALGEEHDPP